MDESLQEDMTRAIFENKEQLFVLSSCDVLKSGEGSLPGIGEPICAFFPVPRGPRSQQL